jgi:hypothetical protein
MFPLLEKIEPVLVNGEFWFACGAGCIPLEAVGGGDDLGLVHDEAAALVHSFVVSVDRLHVGHPRLVFFAFGTSVNLSIAARIGLLVSSPLPTCSQTFHIHILSLLLKNLNLARKTEFFH